MIRSFVAAIQYLTVFPGLPRLPGNHRGARALWFFPVIGAAVGYFQMLGIETVRKLGMGAVEFTALAALLISLALTRCVHVAGASRALERLFPPKDCPSTHSTWDTNRPGTLGVIAIVCLLVTRLEFYLTAVDTNVVTWPIVVSALGRWSMALAGWRGRALPHRGHEDFLFHIRLHDVVIAGTLPVFLAFHYYHRGGMILVVTALVAACLVRASSRVLRGGVSAPTLHLANEMAEILLLFVLIFETMFMGH